MIEIFSARKIFMNILMNSMKLYKNMGGTTAAGVGGGVMDLGPFPLPYILWSHIPLEISSQTLIFTPPAAHTKCPGKTNRMKCVIDSFNLEPYSQERLIVASGYSYEEVVEWYKDLFSTTHEKQLSKIKLHFEWYREHLKFFEDLKSDFEKMMDKTATVQGSFIDTPLISYPKCKIRMILLKEGWDPTNPSNVVTLAHEVLHLCQEYLPLYFNRDIEHEAEAYFHSFVMDRIIQLFQ
jgi:hypothetical protein